MNWKHMVEVICPGERMEYFRLECSEFVINLDKVDDKCYTLWLSSESGGKQVSGIEEAEEIVQEYLVKRILELDKRIDIIKKYLGD